MLFQFEIQDILKVNADAIVIPVKKRPVVGNGLDRKVFKKAGFDSVIRSRQKFGILYTGQSVITPGFRLHSKYIIHTVTPNWDNGNPAALYKLKQCYINSLECAVNKGLKSIVFPVLSSGARRFPFDIAQRIAVDSINEYLNLNKPDINVYIAIHPAYAANSNILLSTDNNSKDDLHENMKNQYGTYERNLNNEIKASGMKKSEYYDKYVHNTLKKEIINYEETANIIGYDKTSLYKYQNSIIKKPHKHRVIALAIVMELSDEERYRFINCAGYSYPSDERDWFIEENIYAGIKDFQTINEKLFEWNPELTLDSPSKINRQNEIDR